jgi:hypothetical protein
VKKIMRKLIPSKVIYLWERCRIRRIELFTGEDLEKMPEIHRDTEKMPELPTHGSFAKAHQRKLDKQERRRKHHHGKGH